MGNTTIDGLKVRSAKKPAPRAKKSTGATLDLPKKSSSGTKRTSASGRAGSGRPTTSRTGTINKPASSRAVAKDFAQQNDGDWSDLLGQMSDEKVEEMPAKKVARDDFDDFDDDLGEDNFENDSLTRDWGDDKVDVFDDGKSEEGDDWLSDWGGEGDGLLDEDFNFNDERAPKKSGRDDKNGGDGSQNGS